MKRALQIGLGVVFLAIAGGLVFVFGFLPADRPNRVDVPGLSAEASVRVSDAAVHLDAASTEDAFTALGYAHGAERGWTAVLWRRTALGTLASWFGPDLRRLDRHTRRLGLARHARQAYRTLPDASKRRLQAYARGMNAALTTDRVLEQDAFVTLEHTPEPWEPWHTLAVERLVAWLAVPAMETAEALPDTTAASSRRDLRAFRDADRLLRHWLHVHHLNRSIAWAVRDSSRSGRAVLFQRHVTGASAASLLHEVILTRPGLPARAVATIPGTTILPAGSGDDVAWAHLLASPADWTRVPVDSTRLRQWTERIQTHRGTESLLTVHRLGDALPFFPPPDSLRPSAPDAATPDTTAADTTSRAAAPDTIWALRWSGFRPVTDTDAWTRRAGLTPPDTSRISSASPDSLPFRLFEPLGLTVGADGQWTVNGSPRVVASVPNGVLVGISDWAPHQADALRQMLARRAAEADPNAVPPPLPVARVSADDSSTWAGQTLPVVLASLTPLADGPPRLRDAVTYLRNWDHTYDRASIGASIFEAWMRAYRADVGRLPGPADSTTYFAPYRRRRAFVQAVDRMTRRYGADLRQWRWERVAPDRRAYPLWSADSLVALDLRGLGRTRYAPLDRPGRGHPTTLSGGTSSIRPNPLGPAPAAWDAWTTPGQTTLTVRRLRFDPTRFLARPFLEGTRPQPIRLQPLPDDAPTTRLRPAP